MIKKFVCIGKIFDNFYCNVNIYILVNHLYYLCIQDSTQNLFIPHASHFLLSCPYLHLILLIHSASLSKRFDNEVIFGY